MTKIIRILCLGVYVAMDDLDRVDQHILGDFDHLGLVDSQPIAQVHHLVAQSASRSEPKWNHLVVALFKVPLEPGDALVVDGLLLLEHLALDVLTFEANGRIDQIGLVRCRLKCHDVNPSVRALSVLAADLLCTLEFLILEESNDATLDFVVSGDDAQLIRVTESEHVRGDFFLFAAFAAKGLARVVALVCWHTAKVCVVGVEFDGRGPLGAREAAFVAHEAVCFRA